MNERVKRQKTVLFPLLRPSTFWFRNRSFFWPSNLNVYWTVQFYTLLFSRLDQGSKSRKNSCTIKKITHEIVRDKNCARFFWSKVNVDILFLIKMPIFVDESEEKGSKRRIDVKLVNKGKNYDPFYPIFQQLSSTIFARFKFIARFFSCTKNILATHGIVHKSTIRYFSWFRTLDLNHQNLLSVKIVYHWKFTMINFTLNS